MNAMLKRAAGAIAQRQLIELLRSGDSVTAGLSVIGAAAVALEAHAELAKALEGDARAVIAALRDPDHDATAGVVRPGEDRTAAVAIFNGIIDEILR
jgi:hypothetical protein